MITKNQLLTAPEAELPELLGEVFELEWGTCKWNKLIGRRDEIPQYRCSECGRECIGAAGPQACKKQPPKIDTTDWNEAMRFRDRAVEKHDTIKFTEALRTVWHKESVAIDFRDWLLFKAQPVHYLIAAALLEIKEQ